MEHVSVKPFNKPFEAHPTMSAFSAKEVAVLTGKANLSGLNIHPLKQLIAARYPQAEWDQAYIMAWQILSAMSKLAKRPTTSRVTWYWGIPYSPRTITRDGVEQRVPYIATSVEDEETLPAIWKHDHGRLLTMLKVLSSPAVGNDVYDEFDLEGIYLVDVDRAGCHIMLQWFAKEGTTAHRPANAMFIRTTLIPKGEKVQNAGMSGAHHTGNKITDMHGSKGIVEMDPKFISKNDVSRKDRKPKAEMTPRHKPARTDLNGPGRGFTTPLVYHFDDVPGSNRKGENAKRHDRRNKGKNKNRSKWDD